MLTAVVKDKPFKEDSPLKRMAGRAGSELSFPPPAPRRFPPLKRTVPAKSRPAPYFPYRHCPASGHSVQKLRPRPSAGFTENGSFADGAESEFQGSKKSDRLQKKAEKAGKKTEAAKKKLPKTKEYSLERVFDEKTGRAKYVLFVALFGYFCPLLQNCRPQKHFCPLQDQPPAFSFFVP